ncbi:hypothetical protein T11_7821 [Trichinella zimbabwensis]|uniref:Uncharacterized protein n=1 Tax=Trichinella zimbabwensis TaxID=268475 RepID=A0A0V1GAR3_9BILA|nr:hypothetical protein T11_7821 [Trichinella zimbabwensis]
MDIQGIRYDTQVLMNINIRGARSSRSETTFINLIKTGRK